MRTPAGDAVALWIIAVVASLFFLREASDLLIPIILALLISYALEPLVAWMQKHRLPRTSATIVVLGTLLGVVGTGGYALRDEAQQALQSLPEIARRARVLASDSSSPATPIQQAAAELQGTSGSTGHESGDAAAGGQGGRAGASEQNSVMDLSSWLQRGVASVFTIAGDVTVIIFLVFFLLLSGNRLRNRIVEISGPDAERRKTTRQILEEIDAQVQRFLLVRLFTSAVVAGATWGVLAWMGVDNAVVWGMLAGVFNSIPYFGPIIVSGGLLLVGLAQNADLPRALQMSGAALVITSLEGWLLTPPLLGKAERMSALAVFLGLLVWTWIWGPWGTILAVPMLVVLKSVADHVTPLKPIGRLLAP